MKNKIIKTIIFIIDNIYLWLGLFYLIHFFIDFNNKDSDIFIVDLFFAFCFMLIFKFHKLNEKIDKVKQESLKNDLRAADALLKIVEIEKELKQRITLLENKEKGNNAI